MSLIDHFSAGLITPALAYAISTVGAMLGLLLTSRAHLVGGRDAAYWLAGAAFAIGGTGIWAMHFIAMTGFHVPGTQIRYDVPLTAVSAVIAVVVVGAGLFLVHRGDGRTPFLLGGGLLTGLGVAGMHYLGMYAMNLSGHVAYDPLVVALSVVIAVVAATVALWFTLRVRRPVLMTGAALLMGVAVSGMHYTGMLAMAVDVHTGQAAPAGSQAIDFLVPLIVVLTVITVGLLLAVLLSPSEREMLAEREMSARLERREMERRDVDLFGTPRGDRAGF